MALTLFRRRATYALIDPAPIPVPRFSIDGWTFSGTPAAAALGSLPRQDLRDLETLLHGVLPGWSVVILVGWTAALGWGASRLFRWH